MICIPEQTEASTRMFRAADTYFLQIHTYWFIHLDLYLETGRKITRGRRNIGT